MSVSETARALNLVQVHIERQAAIPEFVTISGLEDRYRRALLAEWKQASQRAIAVVLRALRAQQEEALGAWAGQVPELLVDAFREQGWPSTDLQGMSREVISTVYHLSADVIARRVAGEEPPILGSLKAVQKADPEIAATFGTVDEDALTWLGDSQVFWLRRHFDPATIEEIRMAGALSLSGLTQKEAADALRKWAEKAFGVGAFSGLSEDYFEGVAVNAATTARVSGSLLQMRSLGVTTYEYVAILDERTSDICKALDGKRFSVTAAADRIEDMVTGPVDPQAIRSLHKWEPRKFGTILEAQGVDLKPGQALTAAQSQTVMRNGFAFPPQHFRCRSTVDISFGEDAVDLETPALTG